MRSIRQFLLLLLPILVCFISIAIDGALSDLTDSTAFIAVIFGFFSLTAAIYVWVYQKCLQHYSWLKSFLISAALLFICCCLLGYVLVRVYNNEESYTIPVLQGLFFIVIFGFYIAAVRIYKSVRNRSVLEFPESIKTYALIGTAVFLVTAFMAFLAQIDFLPDDFMSDKKFWEFVTLVIPSLSVLIIAAFLMLYFFSKNPFLKRNLLVNIMLVGTILSVLNIFNPALPKNSEAIGYFGYMLLIFGATSTLAAIVLVRNSRRNKAIESDKLKASFRKNEAAFQQLRSQVNPHFFLNNLNMLLSYIETDPSQALVFGKRLSGIYQKFLKSDTADFVRLDQELAFASEYLEVYKAKFGEGIQVKLEPIPVTTHYILAHVVQEAIDNIIKHNSGEPGNPLHITIGIQDDALVISNNILPRQTTASNGTGLANITERYKILTGKEPLIRKTESHFRIGFPIFSLA